MTAALGGLDALVFTGGVGEHSAGSAQRPAPASRSSASRSTRRATSGRGDGEISAAERAARTVVVRAREDLEIARQVRSVLETYR